VSQFEIGAPGAQEAQNLPMLKIKLPEVLPASPLSLWCPYCGAAPGTDCQTLKGGFAILHLVRVAAAAMIDAKGL
jgi:hypothetical protein